MRVRPMNSSRSPPVSSKICTSSERPAVAPSCTLLTRPSTVTLCRRPSCRWAWSRRTGPSGRRRTRRLSERPTCGDDRAGRPRASAWRRSRRSIASCGSVVSNGTMVAATCGIRPTASAIRSAVRSCSSRCDSRAERAPRQQQRHLGPVLDDGVVGQLGDGPDEPAVGAVDDLQRVPVAQAALDPLLAAARPPPRCRGRRARRAARSAAGCRRSAARAGRRGRAGRRARGWCAARSAARSCLLLAVRPHAGHQVQRARLGPVALVQPHQHRPADREQQRRRATRPR